MWSEFSQESSSATPEEEDSNHTQSEQLATDGSTGIVSPALPIYFPLYARCFFFNYYNLAHRILWQYLFLHNSLLFCLHDDQSMRFGSRQLPHKLGQCRQLLVFPWKSMKALGGKSMLDQGLVIAASADLLLDFCWLSEGRTRAS